MLTFTQAQIKRFQTSWQIEQLQAQLPAILRQLAETHPEFYARNRDEQHEHHGWKLIEQAVPHGYTQIEQIQQLLDMEYQTRVRLYDHKGIQPLYQAGWLEPQDRIDAIQYLVERRVYEDHNAISAYCQLDAYPLAARCQEIANQTLAAYADDAQAVYIQMLRQALYHALLKEALKATQGWQAWQSDRQTARIGIEHPEYQRRIQLQPADNNALQAILADSEAVPLLKLYIPDQLNSEQQEQINSLLAHWVLDLHSVGQMKHKIGDCNAENSDIDPASNQKHNNPAGVTHA